MKDTAPTTAPTTTLSGLFVRLYWLILGNILLIMMAMLIFLNRESFFSGADLGYWGALALLIVARYVDVKRVHGLTSEGEPATMSHFKRYAARVAGAGGALWGLAQAGSELVG